ncbi:MAG: hypothetical protein P8Y70_06850 [Candidatus Lokiarchaeota archaeon]
MKVVKISWSPPKKVTVIISFIILLLGIGLFIYLLLGDISMFPDIPISGYSKLTIYSMISIGLVFIAWFLMLLGVLVRGM